MSTSGFKNTALQRLNQSLAEVWEAASKGHVSSALPSMFTGQRYYCLAMEKINVLKVSPSKQHYILWNLQCMFTEGKQMLQEQGEAPLLPLQFNTTGRFMHTIVFVCRVEEHEAYCISRAIYQTLLWSLYWLSMSTNSKKGQQGTFT